jgi:hypothetical protein
MSLETVFSLCSGVALLGWIGLVVAPRWALARDIIPSVLAPLLLGSIYASLMFAFSNEAPSEGGFDTLESVKMLFGVDGLLLAGWIHYLAFDLFVGGWIVRDSQEHEISHRVGCSVSLFHLNDRAVWPSNLPGLATGKASHGLLICPILAAY